MKNYTYVFNVFFGKKHDFLRFLELLHTFSRTLVLSPSLNCPRLIQAMQPCRKRVLYDWSYNVETPSVKLSSGPRNKHITTLGRAEM